MLLGESFHAMTGMGGHGWNSSVLLGSPRFYLGSISALFSRYPIKFCGFLGLCGHLALREFLTLQKGNKALQKGNKVQDHGVFGIQCRSAILHALQGRIALVGILPMFMVAF